MAPMLIELDHRSGGGKFHLATMPQPVRAGQNV